MAERIGSVWAIDIGNTSLKALRLSNESGTLEVIGFDNITHGKVLSGAGIKDQEKQELIAISLRQFVQANDLGRDEIIVAVPSANSFARFVNLPPVEQKRIPEIVKFEASQQIPFDINEVAWDWQLMTEAGAVEAKVGIFAIKNDVVTAELEHFSRENLEVTYVQIAPMALYNYIFYDRPDLMRSDTQATVVLNIGAETTDLVVCTKSDVWQRTIAMGGNAFTKAIADTFKLNFEKAEKLKRTAPMSKYARQILQAMKPVFTDLASEIQRSLGFYTSSHSNVKLARVIALGGGTKMRGLLQYLQQSLQMPIERPDAFKQVGINASVSAAKFHESICDFGVVYGLGVQALGIGRIESNLLPRSIAKSMVWASKTKFFVLAACLILVASVLAFARTLIDRASYTSKVSQRETTKLVLDAAKKAQSDLKAEETRTGESEAVIKKEFDLFKYRDMVPLLYQKLIGTLPNARSNPEQAELYRAFASGNAETIKEKFPDRRERKQIFVTGMSVYYTLDIGNAQFGAMGFEKGLDSRDTLGDAGSGGQMASRDMMMRGGGGRGGAPSRYSPTMRGRRVGATRPMGPGSESAAHGFVVTISGYSPYKTITELLDPVKVQDDPNKWGLVTRLVHLDSMFDGNSPFELYKKTDKQHFDLQTGEVDLEAEIPPGIGVKKNIEGKGNVIIDPMTNEIICKVTNTDDGGKKVAKVNDSWFVLNFKLKWKDAPGAFVEEGSGSPEAAPSASPPPPSPAKAPALRKKTNAPKLRGGDE
ncbi:MAG: type IV pilus assembly protein PilM [Sedimentisphaerales bacterium]